MAEFGFGVSLRGYPDKTSQLTFNLASATTADHVGRAMEQDTTMDAGAKPASDGAQILGRLHTYEDRKQSGIKTGAVALRFSDLLPIKAGLTGAEAVVRGSTVVGAGDGFVKARVVSAAAAPDKRINFVSAIVTEGGQSYAVVTQY